MNEIRFNNPVKKEEENVSAPVTEVQSEKKVRGGAGSKVMKTFLLALLLVVAVSLFVFGKDFAVGLFSSPSDEWSAVFLSNGQVYFGKIYSNTKSDMKLREVYYLQVEGEDLSAQSAEALNQTRFKLVKLGQELHGPKDDLIVNKDHIIFYEYLREDSKVVESIKNF